MSKMEDDISLLEVDDNAEEWHHHNETQRQREQQQARVTTREAIERLGQAIAILDILDPEVQRLREQLINMRRDLEEKNSSLAEQIVKIARENGLL
tara:strand:+ start:1376 stop:1663 length:288 start_codon:yes stop_codon:yes gene_type:complete